MKIGFTERGDGGRDLSWVQKCLDHKVDGVVVVTKSLTQPCADAILNLHKSGFPVILHATTTGWGGSIVEPNVPNFHDQLNAVADLVSKGFDLTHVVVRIDPIFPTVNGLNRVQMVINYALNLGLLPGGRCRLSVLDEYQHVKQRFRNLGYGPIYGDKNFYASPEQFKAVAETLALFPSLKFETCAEPGLSKYDPIPGQIVHTGCLSNQDLKLMGLPEYNGPVNGQNRSGCLCLACKTELLTCRHPCYNQCAYCYWKD